MAQTDPDTYDPVYVALDDIPLVGPDNYTTTEKRRALFDAEAIFELDVNDGDALATSELTNAHRSAVLNLGTHVLTQSASSPDDVTLGDMADAGGQSQDYASHFLEEYERIVDKILDVEQKQYGSNVSVSVNTRDSKGMEGRYPYNRDVRFPDE